MRCARRSGVLFGVVAGLSSTLVYAQPTCPERKKCTFYCPDRIEAELAAPLDPELAENLAASPNPPNAWKPLAKLLRASGATFKPSVPATLARQTGLMNVYTLQWSTRQSPTVIERTIKKLERMEQVVRVARVPTARPPYDPWVSAPGDVNCKDQWYIERTGIDTAWACEASGNDIQVSVVDWGFVQDHDDIKDALDPKHFKDVCSQSPVITPNAYSYHGAGSVGLVAARQNNNGIQGAAYRSTIRAVEASCVSDDFDPCDECWDVANPWAAGIAEVIAWKSPGQPSVLLLEVETCCHGNYEGSLAVKDAVEKAVAKGIVVVVPAGNGNVDAGCSDQGGAIPHTGSIVVGATSADPANPLTVDSNFGTRIDLSAPGASLLTCGEGFLKKPCGSGARPVDKYTRQYEGTSGASAIVAGVVALMLEKDPNLKPPEIVVKLKSSGTTVGGAKVGGVFLNAAGAIALADPDHCQKE